MSQFSPHAPRVGVLAVAASEPTWAQQLQERWSTDDVRVGYTGEGESPNSRWPDLLLLVREQGMDGDQWPAAGRIAARASAQGALVVGIVSGRAQGQEDAYGQQALHGEIDVVASTSLDIALNALLQLMLMSGAIRLEIEELDAFIRKAPSVLLSVGWGEPGPAGIEVAMADAIQTHHQAVLVAPMGRWLVGLLSDSALGAAGFNAAGEWLHSRVADTHEITVLARCDEREGAMTGVVVLAGE